MVRFLNVNVLGTGSIQDVFHRTETFSRLRLRLKMMVTASQNWSAQSLNSLWLIPSGPTAFLTLRREGGGKDVRELLHIKI